MMMFIQQEVMKGLLVLICRALLCSAVSGLFTVDVEQKSYESELHGDVKLVCLFSQVKSLSDLLVIWHRIEPLPEINVYRYERGKEKQNYTNVVFGDRAQLIHEQLSQSRAVLHLKKLRIKDSGTYQCVVKYQQDDVDYKHITLSVTALNTPIKKSVRKTEVEDEVELSCEFAGYPLAEVLWSDGQTVNLTEKSSKRTRVTDEDLINITSRLTVRRDLVRNYTCSFLTEGKVRQTTTFIIPHEIPASSSHHYVWIGSVIVVLLVIIFISIIYSKRKNGQKDKRSKSSKCPPPFPQTAANNDCLLTIYENTPHPCDITREEHAEKLQTLRDALIQRYSQPITDTEMNTRLMSYCSNVLPHVLHLREGQAVNVSSIFPEKRQTILLLGKPGSGKTTTAQILSSCWAQSLTIDPWNIKDLQLVVSVNCRGTNGDFFQLVKSNIPNETPLDVSDIRETLLGSTDCLVILDGYKEGNRDLDETLGMFLKERQTCRILVMSHPGECPSLENKVGTVLNLIHKSDDKSET
ncbi:uncharacterized protein [Misgurnus anguillicaudatus]|uniref:uncharacterized protein isoform X1 n=2 Tax=Misgurnus anguillicaudatus TaxID=75329 RepID=UPI003CCF5B6A